MLAGVPVTAQAEPQINNGMPGIVMAGSQNYNKIPEKARKFVDKHFKGTAVSKCEQYFAKGQYEVELASGGDIFNRLVKDGYVNNVESIEFRKGRAVEVEIGIEGPDTYIFDLNGTLIAIED